MQGEERDYTLTYGAEGQSSWTFWIDNPAYSAGPVIRSLVEVTSIQIGNAPLKTASINRILSDEACCRNAYASDKICTNQNPALESVCEDAYSYAFDDNRASYVYQVTLDDATTLQIKACP
ncbi:hypothetical protein D6C89_10233 [Aureobasidium pullulans]|nr:hypothetical protein D6C89_10233 [Aureobasidium pullulans]